MNIIISHSITKRRIDGSFQLCGSKEDLLSIAEQITESVDGGFNYGWIDILTDKPRSMPNEHPVQWD